MSLQYHDPRAAQPTLAAPYRLGADFSQAVTVGLLANGFPGSVEFLDALEMALGAALPTAHFKRYNKGNPSIPASAELLAAMQAECDAVASAYGH
ncbi:MAG: hypothetical protein EXR83_04445 [Gammaproteobacteria bacterium]|nr:hypothetical protein [Gammaproteobacteria bacterium]